MTGQLPGAVWLVDKVPGPPGDSRRLREKQQHQVASPNPGAAWWVRDMGGGQSGLCHVIARLDLKPKI